jgi:hypothetical protein
MRTHPVVIVMIVLLLVCIMPLIVVSLTDSKSAPAVSRQAESGCACAVTPAHVTKFLIFWKEKEKEGEKEVQVFKISDKLFDSITDAWKTVPSNAAEVRIITVRLD